MNIPKAYTEVKRNSVVLNTVDVALFMNKLPFPAVVLTRDREILVTNLREQNRKLLNELLRTEIVQKKIDECLVKKFNSQFSHISIENRLFEIEINCLDKQLLFITAKEGTDLSGTDFFADQDDSKFKVLVDHAPEAILLMDYDERRYIDANPNAIKLFGYSKEELINTRLGDLSPEYQADGRHSATFSAEMIKAAIDGEDVVFEWVIKRKTGEEVPCEVRVVRLPSKDRILMRSSIIDITERKKSELSLRRSEEKFRILYDNAVFGVASVAPNENFTEVNPTFCQMLGYTRDELLKMNLKSITHPDDYSVNKTFFDKAKKDHESSHYQIEKRYVKKNGDILYALLSSTFVEDLEGEAVFVAAVQDITELKRRNRLIQQRENQLEAFVESNPLPVAMLDRELKYILVSDEWKKSFESPKGVELLGQRLYDMHPEIPLRWKLSYQKALSGEKVKFEKDYLILPSGKANWYRWEVRPWHDHDKSIGGIVIYSEIITKQIEVENKIREQEHLFHSVFESSSIAWLVCDIQFTREKLHKIRQQGIESLYNVLDNQMIATLLPHFKILSYNKQLSEIFGFDERQSLTAKRLMTFFKEDYRQIFVKELVSIFNEEKSFETEFTITNAKGVEKTLFLSVNYPKDDDYSKVIYGLLDITDLRQSINALRDSEFRYRTMFENNKLGVIYANHQTDVIRFNEAFFQMFGYSMNELSLIEENAILLPQYIDESNRLYRQLENGNIRNFQMEKEYKTRSGNNIYVNTSVTGLYDEKDQYYGSVTIIEDVSEKKKSQQKIEIQNVELKKINAELDQFVYSAAHDLRAPIANVQGLLQLIRHEQISEQALAYLDLQEKSLEKLDHFISNIVNFSRNSRLNLDLSNISPIALISESIEHHRFAPNANKLDVKLEISEDIAFTSDANRLNVVINNLVSNAIRYMDLRKTTNQLVISVRLEGAKVYFVFRDNGLGIEHSYQDQIFDLFFRAHENSNGTGIGLYLVKETVEKLGGEIIVNSVPGAFTEFSFYIANQD